MSMSRTTSVIVVFTAPFSLSALESPLPPGAYSVETEEELLPGLSFAAYRRTAMWLHIPGGHGGAERVVNIDPVEFDAARAHDEANGTRGPAAPKSRTQQA
jgi:hypothetical protein